MKKILNASVTEKKRIVELAIMTCRGEFGDGKVRQKNLDDDYKHVQTVIDAAYILCDKDIDLTIEFLKAVKKEIIDKWLEENTGFKESGIYNALTRTKEKTIDKALTKPDRYNKGEIDLIEMFAKGAPFEGFLWSQKFTIIRYIYRFDNKNGLEDLDKAIVYINRLKEYYADHIAKKR